MPTTSNSIPGPPRRFTWLLLTNTDPAGVGTGVGVGVEVGEPAGSIVGDPVASRLTCGGQGSPEIVVPAGEGVPVGPEARTGSVANEVRIANAGADGVGDGDRVAVGVTVCVGDGDGHGVGVAVDVDVAVAVSVGGAVDATVRDNAAVGVRGTVDVTVVDGVRIALADGAVSVPGASMVTLTAGVEVFTTVAVSVSVALIATEPVMGAVDDIATAGAMATAVS